MHVPSIIFKKIGNYAQKQPHILSVEGVAGLMQSSRNYRFHKLHYVLVDPINFFLEGDKK